MEFLGSDVESELNEAFGYRETSTDGSSDAGESQRNRDHRKEQFPKYQHPHERGHNLQEDNFIHFKNDNKGVEDPDKKQGTDNNKYQRLKLAVPFALSRNKLQALKPQFPGVYFHCKDNGNHDHEFSHVVTMIGTRLMQRRYPMSSKILDLYGSPNSCDTYNKSQERLEDRARTMKATVHKHGPADFIREAQKWGPRRDEQENERYHTMTLKQMVESGEIENYDVIQMIHTLYYVDFSHLAQALHHGRGRQAYALVHKHKHDSGSLNDGEQTYDKKTVTTKGKSVTLVRQENVATGSTYVHPDLTPLLFKKGEKLWFPPIESNGEENKQGLAWDLRKVNEETWIVFFVALTKEDPHPDDVNYSELWDNDGDKYKPPTHDQLMSNIVDADFWTDTYVDTPPATPPRSGEHVRVEDDKIELPGENGSKVVIELTNVNLFEKLRANVAGKKRGPVVFEEIVRLAKHLNDPSAIIGEKVGMQVEPSRIMDHAVAAYLVDVSSEQQLMNVIADLKPTLRKHANAVGFKTPFKVGSFTYLLDALRAVLTVSKQVNGVIRSKDRFDAAADVFIAKIDGD